MQELSGDKDNDAVVDLDEVEEIQAETV